MPREDSYFFQDFLKKYLKSQNKEISFLDMGTGSGILCKTALEFLPREKILGVDINPKAVNHVLLKGIRAIQSDLFANINENFDLIVFNAPYLPKDEYNKEPKDSQLETTAGKKGDEIIIKFLKQAKQHLTKNGKILLLLSSLTPMKNIEKYKPKIVAEKSLFFEKLIIFEIRV